MASKDCARPDLYELHLEGQVSALIFTHICVRWFTTGPFLPLQNPAQRYNNASRQIQKPDNAAKRRKECTAMNKNSQSAQFSELCYLVLKITEDRRLTVMMMNLYETVFQNSNLLFTNPPHLHSDFLVAWSISLLCFQFPNSRQSYPLGMLF